MLSRLTRLLKALGVIVGGTGIAMLSLAVYAETRLRQLETLDAVRDAPGGSFVTVEDLSIHFEAHGVGDPVVLIHGFGGSTYTWRLNVAPLATRYRVYALDLAGFGYSERTDRPVFGRTQQAKLLHDFLRALGEKRPVVLIGSSLGASVAVRFALDYPEATRGLVLLAPSLFWNGPRLRRFAPLFEAPWLGRVITRTLYYLLLANDRATARILASAYGSRLEMVTGDVREALLRPLRVRGSADAARGLVRSRDDRPFNTRLAEIKVPTLIVAGSQDRAVPLEQVEQAHRALPESRLVVLEDAGHLLHEDEPEAFNDMLINWLANLSAPTGSVGYSGSRA